MLEDEHDRAKLGKCRFKGGMNVSLMAVRASFEGFLGHSGSHPL